MSDTNIPKSVGASEAGIRPVRTALAGHAHPPRRLRLHVHEQPETPIEHLIARMGEYLHLPDPLVVEVLMGAVAANMVEGCPVWLMLCGPSGSGKSEVLNSLRGIPRMEPADSIDSEAAFLSGTPKKDLRRGATGGLLRMIEPHGGLVMKDFTGILSLQPDKLKKILDVFRQVYDGTWDRPIGGEGGRVLTYRGKAAMFSGVTGKIDDHHQVSASLGERWLFFRMGADMAAGVGQRNGRGEEMNGFAQLKRGLQNQSVKGWREQIRDLVQAFFEGLDLRFGEVGERRALEPNEILRISSIAAVAARSRSGVTRDWHNKEILAAAETEFESRIGEELGQLYIGMEIIGVGKKERWRALGKVALDSMPKLRRMILKCVTEAGEEGVSISDILRHVTVREAESASRSAVDRAIVDLAVHGVLEKHSPAPTLEGENPGRVKVMLTDWMAAEYKRGFHS